MAMRIATAVAVVAAAIHGAASAQDTVVRFEPTGTPDTYRVLAEFVGALPAGFDASDELCVWSLTQFELVGDAPITIDPVSVNDTYDTTYTPIEIVDNGTTRVYFKGEMGDPFAPEIVYDFANPLEVLTFTYAGDPAAFTLELTGWNVGFVREPDNHANTLSLIYMYFDGRLGDASFAVDPLAPACLADVNADGLVTPADFNAWIIAFNTNAPECDQNGDGACTPADFNAWILNFNAGC